MNIGFIGFGEAAYNIALGFSQNGTTGIRANDAMMNHPVMGQQVHARAAEAQVELVEDAKEVARWADVLFAAVPSSFTMDVCNTVKDELRPGQIYADVSASTPATATAPSLSRLPWSLWACGSPWPATRRVPPPPSSWSDPSS